MTPEIYIPDMTKKHRFYRIKRYLRQKVRWLKTIGWLK